MCNRRWPASVLRPPVLIAWWIILLISAGCRAPAPATFAEGTTTLIVDLDGFRNNQGVAVVSLFRGENGFPDEVAASVATVSAVIRENRATVSFADLPYGDYAVSVLHDEDGDGQMATGLLGTPREGFGFSGYPDYRFGPPEFAEVHFLLVEPQRQMTIAMRYETGRRQHQEDGRAAESQRPKE